jgi:hypothetical protein
MSTANLGSDDTTRRHPRRTRSRRLPFPPHAVFRRSGDSAEIYGRGRSHPEYGSGVGRSMRGGLRTTPADISARGPPVCRAHPSREFASYSGDSVTRPRYTAEVALILNTAAGWGAGRAAVSAPPPRTSPLGARPCAALTPTCHLAPNSGDSVTRPRYTAKVVPILNTAGVGRSMRGDGAGREGRRRRRRTEGRRRGEGDAGPKEGARGEGDAGPKEGARGEGDAGPKEGARVEGDAGPKEGARVEGDAGPKEGAGGEGETAGRRRRRVDGDGGSKVA